MWINNRISKPLREGRYRTLVDWDGFGNLLEGKNELYNGKDWDWIDSASQYISYWWAEKEDYKIITDHLEEQQEKYMREREEHSKNYGGL